MICRGAVFGLLGERLVQLLAGPQADVLQLHSPGAHHLYHLSRKVHYLDGTSHLQAVDAVRVGHSARLQDQGDGFGGDHEIARHLRVGYGHRPPGLYLPPEGRYDAPPAPQDVAEAHRSVERLRVLLGRRPNEHLREALRRPHDVHGVYGLVGRDVDELLRPELADGELSAREALAGELLVQVVEAALIAIQEDQAGGAEV